MTERLGYFKDAGLNADIADLQSGARAQQPLIGGNADIGVGCLGFRLNSRAVGGSGRSVPVAYP
jgi:NitT/TauT family transport system substrate-binding protein